MTAKHCLPYFHQRPGGVAKKWRWASRAWVWRRQRLCRDYPRNLPAERLNTVSMITFKCCLDWEFLHPPSSSLVFFEMSLSFSLIISLNVRESVAKHKPASKKDDLFSCNSPRKTTRWLRNAGLEGVAASKQPILKWRKLDWILGATLGRDSHFLLCTTMHQWFYVCIFGKWVSHSQSFLYIANQIEIGDEDCTILKRDVSLPEWCTASITSMILRPFCCPCWQFASLASAEMEWN